MFIRLRGMRWLPSLRGIRWRGVWCEFCVDGERVHERLVEGGCMQKESFVTWKRIVFGVIVITNLGETKGERPAAGVRDGMSQTLPFGCKLE